MQPAKPRNHNKHALPKNKNICIDNNNSVTMKCAQQSQRDKNIRIDCGSIIIRGDNVSVKRQKQYYVQRDRDIQDVLSLVHVSKLVSRLANNGYHMYTELETLLSDLGISQPASDIHALLTTYDANMFAATLRKIGIETALYICDELGAPSIITKIIHMQILLDTITTNQIINHNINDTCLIPAYNRGYKLIPHTKSKLIMDQDNSIASINNALNNGLYLTRLMPSNKSHHNVIDEKIMCDTLKRNFAEITDVWLSHLLIANTAHVHKFASTNNVYTLCTNVSRVFSDDNRVRQDLDHNICRSFIKNITHFDVPSLNTDFGSCARIQTFNTLYNNDLSLAPFAKTLKKLTVSYPSVMSNQNLAHCNIIKILYAQNNANITTCKPFAKTLRILDASGNSCMIDDAGLKLCTNIKHLNHADNKWITTYEPFAKTLQVLSTGQHDIKYPFPLQMGNYDIMLSRCTKLRELYIYGHISGMSKYLREVEISECTPFARTLVILYIEGQCKLTDDKLKMCVNLKLVQSRGNGLTMVKGDHRIRPRSTFDMQKTDALLVDFYKFSD